MCWLSIYFGISSSYLLQVALADYVVRFRCVTTVDLAVGASSLEITTILIYINHMITELEELKQQMQHPLLPALRAPPPLPSSFPMTSVSANTLTMAESTRESETRADRTRATHGAHRALDIEQNRGRDLRKQRRIAGSRKI